MQNNDLKSKVKDIIVRALQIVPLIVTVITVVLCLVFIIKNDISLRNIDSLATYFTGSTFTVAVMFIVIHVVKSVALFVSPVILYTLAGIVFEDLWVALLVGFIGSFLSLILPYYLGKFLGMDAVNTLKKRFKAIEKIDGFAGENVFGIVFICKVGAIMPSDLNSLVFGAMNLPFGKYFLSSNVSLLILDVLWTLLGAKGSISDPLSYLYILPAVIMAVAGAIYMGRNVKKKSVSEKETESE